MVNDRLNACRLGLLALVGVAALLQGGCNTGPRMAGIDGSGSPVVAQGPIQGFGSVIVNGEHYGLTNAEIRVNGELATETQLAIGQIVTISGSVDTQGNKVADSVDFEANVRGPVQSVDVATGTLVVLGQHVSVRPETVLEIGGTGLDSLMVGDFVEVSGLVSAGGVINATLIVDEDDSSELRVIGRVSMLDTASFQFNINDLVVDYSGVMLLEGFPSGGPSNADRVLAVGDALDQAGRLVADRVEFRPSGIGEQENHQAEIEGLITRFVSPSDFDVAGFPATTTSGTVYEGGSAASLALNVKVQVEGRVDAQGVIAASKVEVKDGGAVYEDD